MIFVYVCEYLCMPRKAKRGTASSSSGVLGRCECPDVGWELNLGLSSSGPKAEVLVSSLQEKGQGVVTTSELRSHRQALSSRQPD